MVAIIEGVVRARGRVSGSVQIDSVGDAERSVESGRPAARRRRLRIRQTHPRRQTQTVDYR